MRAAYAIRGPVDCAPSVSIEEGVMRLLLSGFEPFGGERVNPSWEVAGAIGVAPPDGVDLELIRLPVRGRISFDRLIPAFEAGGFDAWIGLGEAGGRSHLSVERTGVNVLIDRDENLKAMPEQTLVVGGPAGYFARLPVGEVAAAMRAAGAPSQVSETAGTYICNETLYAMGNHLDTTDARAIGGFIHLPFLPEQTVEKRAGTPSMTLETQVLGVRAAIEFVRDLVVQRARVTAGAR